MSIKLPKELQTTKVKSLPKETRKLVEELLAEKFDIREEVVKPKASDPFRREYTPSNGANAFYGIREDAIFGQSTDGGNGYGDRVSTGFDVRTRRYMANTGISRSGNAEAGIAKAIHYMDMANIPYKGRKIFISARRMQYLLQEPQIGMSANVDHRYYEYNGCEIVVIPETQQEHISAEY